MDAVATTALASRHAGYRVSAPRARSSAAALRATSASSSRGTESAVMPPPAPTVAPAGSSTMTADRHREVDPPVGPKVSERARVDAARATLEWRRAARSRAFRRSGHRAGREARGDGVDAVEPGAAARERC